VADDEELLRALHAEHGDALFAHALRLCDGDRQRAEDLVQETLLRAWRHPEALAPERGPVRAWLFTTARRLAIDAWRRREARVGEVITDAPPEPSAELDERPGGGGVTIAEALGRSASHVRSSMLPRVRRRGGGCARDPRGDGQITHALRDALTPRARGDGAPMSCPFTVDDGAYVLGALAAERAAPEQHLGTCPACGRRSPT
jgi:RNA polymerase sigma factor (sigma-70 family)